MTVLIIFAQQYRNFVFRKMFEKPAIHFDGRADEIVRNVCELSRLDAKYDILTTAYPIGLSPVDGS